MGNAIYEDGSGGRKIFNTYGAVNTRALFNSVYIALFGGNLKESTSTFKERGELDFSWWGNDRKGNPKKWINSSFERTVRGMSLTENNRILAENAAIEDLKKLSDLGTFTVQVTFSGLNKIKLTIGLAEPERDNKFSILWDASKNEVIETIILR